MKVFRIEDARRGTAREAFSGLGGLYVAGRWNFLGNAVVYTSEHLSLAALEKWVHISTRKLDRRYVYFEAEIPNAAIATVEEPTFDPMRLPATDSTRKLGHLWLRRGNQLALKVPSVMIPSECNVLINPALINWERFACAGPFPFEFDQRLAGRPGFSG